MKMIERFKLWRRAFKYKTKYDQGGIAYLIESIQEGQTALDIGAHKAGYLYFIQKQVGKNGKVYAFEPQLNLYEYIRGIKKMFQWDHVTIEHLALSDQKGTATLYIPVNSVKKGSAPGATIVEHKGRSTPGEKQSVHTDTLDNYCQIHDIRPHFLKIDVEGNEWQIFQGGLETIRRYKPKILIEIEAQHVGQDKVLETFQFMESLGYGGQFIKGADRLPLNTFSFERHQNIKDKANYCNNFIFEHRSESPHKV